jgi:hypothetical protein
VAWNEATEEVKYFLAWGTLYCAPRTGQKNGLGELGGLMITL